MVARIRMHVADDCVLRVKLALPASQNANQLLALNLSYLRHHALPLYVLPQPVWILEADRSLSRAGRDAIRNDWASKTPQELAVRCNGQHATFYVDPFTQQCLIRDVAGNAMKPRDFERACGIGAANDWGRTIKVPGARMHADASMLAVDASEHQSNYAFTNMTPDEHRSFDAVLERGAGMLKTLRLHCHNCKSQHHEALQAIGSTSTISWLVEELCSRLTNLRVCVCRPYGQEGPHQAGPLHQDCGHQLLGVMTHVHAHAAARCWMVSHYPLEWSACWFPQSKLACA